MSLKVFPYRLTVVVLALLLAAIHSGCSPTKGLQAGEYLLDENIIEQKGSKIPVDDLAGIVKQTPNRKIGFWKIRFRFHLGLYNIPSDKRIEKARYKKNKRIRRKNARKVRKGKPLKDSTSRTKWEWFRDIGEAPVVLDSSKIEESRKQLQLYMVKKGYYNCIVRDTVTFRRKLASVYYLIDAQEPYTIDCISRTSSDTVMQGFINQLGKSSLLKAGDRIDIDVLEKEREYIASALLDSGYHFFNRSFIYFEIDSTIGNHKVDLYLSIHDVKNKDQFTGEVIETPHQRYRVTKIEIFPDFDSRIENPKYQRLPYHGIDFLHRKKLKYKPKLLSNTLLFNPNEMYNYSKVRSTFRKYAGLGVFKGVSIQFERDTTKGIENGLYANIRLEPAKSQTFSVEADGKHSDGLLGIEGSLAYTHRNLFGGAEELRISLTAGLEAQNSIVSSDQSNTNITGISNTFNTIEFGPTVSLTIPKYVLLSQIFRHHTNGKTQIAASVNFQRRPDYTRGIEDLTWSYIFHEKKAHTFRLDLAEISAVEIGNQSEAFLKRINELNDRQLAASYQNHIISATRFSYEYNGQEINKLKNVFYYKGSIEGAGNMLRGFSKLLDRSLDAFGSYEIVKIRFAQYLKTQHDVRYYRNINKKSQVAYRLFGGLGIPLPNLREALPFEKSFYAGGASGIRAWKARTLGPGSFLDSNRTFDKIGDITLESNIEVRFDLIDWIEGAVFADAGNIWQYREDSLRPGGQFKLNKFYQQFALGGGLGIRMDLGFFLIRFDLAIPIRHPGLPLENRWVFGNYRAFRDDYRIQFNLGIGYPF